jgi:hypothetical protein
VTEQKAENENTASAESDLDSKHWSTTYFFGVGVVCIVVFAFYLLFSVFSDEYLDAREAAGSQSQSTLEKEAFEKIRLVEPQLTMNQVKASDLYPGLVEIYHEEQLRYVLGDLVIRGELINIEDGENITQKRLKALGALAGATGGEPDSNDQQAQTVASQAPQTAEREPRIAPNEVASRQQPAAGQNIDAALAMLANQIIPDEMTVVYPAEGEERFVITAFSDVTCPVCARNHADYPELQKRGITMRAALFPRNGMDTPEAVVMSRVLCAGSMEERRELLDRAYTGDALNDVQNCDNGYLKNIRDLAVAQGDGLAVTQTPTLMAANGLRINGYPRENPVETLINLLGERGQTGK